MADPKREGSFTWNDIFCVIFSIVAFVFNFVTMWQLAQFLSTQTFQLKDGIIRRPVWEEDMKDCKFHQDFIYGIPVNVSLLVLIWIQHTGMSTSWWKNLLEDSIGVTCLTRSIYVMATSWALQAMMSFWRPIWIPYLWMIDTVSRPSLGWFFTVLHGFSWLMLYSGCIMMDWAELTGVKQVYYSLSGREDPMVLKAPQLQRFYSHMRHPGFLAFTFILWCHPHMSLDRVLLATSIPLYLLYAQKVDTRDCLYSKVQFQRKMQELKMYTS